MTGHTGFKGAWLTEWLLMLGAEVWGLSLPPPTQPALSEQLGLAKRMRHQIGDLRDPATVQAAVAKCQPDYVFHLAALAVVRASYEQPLAALEINVMGTANLLAALGGLRTPCAVVIVTSDKCYLNNEEGRDYRETDALGGLDPYSASKAAAEIVTIAWRHSYFAPGKILQGLVPPVAVASARAGNAIGGGDWAPDRIVPDTVRALERGEPILVRNPASVRPWEHVLEPLGGYLALAAQLHESLVQRSPRLPELCGAFNFGPSMKDHRTVRELVEEILKHWPGRWGDGSDPGAVHEARLLRLATEKSASLLGWRPRWSFAEAVARTTEWYRAVGDNSAIASELTRRQISEYSATTTNEPRKPS